MDVILTEDVSKLGRAGDVVKVKNGYARNLLFPKKLAFPATQANLKRIEQQNKKRQDADNQKKAEAQKLADKLSKVSCTVSVEVNDLEKLYGTISEADVEAALSLEGFQIDKKLIVFEKPIEELGIFEVGINLHPEVSAKIRLWVTKK